MTHPAENDATLADVMEAIRSARTAHEWPVETDDGIDWHRCTCGRRPPLGTNEELWFSDHHDGALAHAAMTAGRVIPPASTAQPTEETK